MKPIVIHTRHFPPGNYLAITLFPFVFTNGELKECDLRHETIHMWQQAALLIIPFYAFYLLFWFVKLVRYRNLYRAYRAIPFERSAYALEGNKNLKTREMAFDWIRRMGKDKK